MIFRTISFSLLLVLAGSIVVGGTASLHAQDGPARSPENLSVAKDAADGLLNGLAFWATDFGQPLDPIVWAELERGVDLPGDLTALTEEESTAVSDLPAKQTEPYVGVWRGAYTCYQGLTGMVVVLERRDDGTIDGVMHFYPTEGGSAAVPRGAYTVRLLMVEKHMFIRPQSWLDRPEGYETVPMAGYVNKNTGLFEGRMLFSGCTDFVLAKMSPSP
jgi:hypothetical protein